MTKPIVRWFREHRHGQVGSQSLYAKVFDWEDIDYAGQVVAIPKGAVQ